MRALLFSGGIDSTCLAVMTQPDLALTIDYGQVCAPGELRAAKHIASLLSLSHRIIEVPLGHLGSGEMTGASSEEGRKLGPRALAFSQSDPPDGRSHGACRLRPKGIDDWDGCYGQRPQRRYSPLLELHGTASANTACQL